MSDQSMASLLAWLREESRLLGWDMIVAMAHDNANLLLRHEYMAQYDRGDYLEPISGSVEVVSNYWRGVLHNFLFDAPRLMFHTVGAPTLEDPNSTRVESLLTMGLISGALVTMENDNVVWRVRRLQSFETLQANTLYLHLEMPQTLVIQADGAMKLDFRFAQDFEMELTGDADFNDQVSIAFRKLFHELEDERRMYRLLVIPEHIHENVRPEKAVLYSQVNPKASPNREAQSYGSGALLVLIRNPNHFDGELPTPEYRYLIPDGPGTGFSATLMISRIKIISELLYENSVFHMILKRFGWSGPIETYFDKVDSSEVIGKAWFRGGELLIPDKYIYGEPTWSRHLMREVPIHILHKAFSYTLTGMQVHRYGPGRYRISGGGRQKVITEATLLANGWSSTFDAESEVQLGYDIYLDTYNRNDDLRMECEDKDNFTSSFARTTLAWHRIDGYPNLQLDFNERQACINDTDFATAPLKQRLKEVADSFLNFSESQHYYISKVITKNFDSAFHTQDIRSPLDTVIFGSISPFRTFFEITPHELIIAPGQSHTFTPSVSDGNVRWAVSNIDPTSSASPGNIGEYTGLYTAPAATTITGNLTRVRVSATQKGGTAHALITVVAQAMSINPLIAVCEADRSSGTGGGDHIVHLSAEWLEGNNTRVTWAIKNPVEGESGSLQPSVDGRTCKFTAHAYVDTKKCVLDEVEVKVQTTESGQTVTRTRQALVLASHVGFGLNLFIAEATPNQLRLIAKRNDVEGTVVEPKWSVAAQSPGVIGEDDGIYVPDSASTQPFALIFAKVEGRLKSEGYLIVPLPYLDFPEELILLSQPHELVETNVVPTH